jgi:hypothetical protein
VTSGGVTRFTTSPFEHFPVLDIPVPDVVGTGEAAAIATLTAAGLVLN